MKMLKKKLSLLLAVALVLGSASTVGATELAQETEAVVETTTVETAETENIEDADGQSVEAADNEIAIEQEAKVEGAVVETIVVSTDLSQENESAEAVNEEEDENESLEGLVTSEDGFLQYYVDGELQYGAQVIEIDGQESLYYFDQSGYAFTKGFLQYPGQDGETCYSYFLSSGKAATGYRDVTVQSVVGEDGSITSEADGKHHYYYFKQDGCAYTEGFLSFVNGNGKTYYFYFTKNGEATTGYRDVTTMHHADADGNITDISDSAHHYYYFQTNGQAFTKGFLSFVNGNGKTYYFYFQSNGQATRGYRDVTTMYHADAEGTITNISDGAHHYYYFQTNGQAFTKGFLSFVNGNGKTYYFYFQSNGQATKGYRDVTTMYHADAEGTISNVSDGNHHYYYFQTNGQAFTKGFLTFVNGNGRSYNFYFLSNGQAVVSELVTVTTTYGADVNGVITNTTDGKTYKYYFGSNGQGSLYAFGWNKVDGTWCYMDGTTVLFKSNGMYAAWTKIKNSSSATRYYVVVDTVNCETYTFRGKSGSWTPYYCWKCSPGKASTPTIKGYYTIQGRGYSFSGPKDSSTLTYTCYYYTIISGSYLFHSVLYNYNTFELRDGRLGQNLSHGCVRLALENAKWFYDNLPTGTKVYIY